MRIFDWLTGRNRKPKPTTSAKGENASADVQLPSTNATPPNLRAIGFWRVAPENPEGLLGWPHPAALVDRGWELTRRGRIVNYLRAGHTLNAYMGYSFCRFDNCRHKERQTLGTKDLTDGHWIWPEGLWHYVADHGIRLPDAFVAEIAARNFNMPTIVPDNSVPVNHEFWLRWVAENTAPPTMPSDACTFDDAHAICTELSTPRWQAAISREYERWQIRCTSAGYEFTDFTGAISGYALRKYLLRFRLLEATAVLSPQQAVAIADEYAEGERLARPFAGMTDSNGQVWWALIMAGEAHPAKPFAEINLETIEIPQPGWAAFLPGGWKVEVSRAMDELAWRFFLEEWRRPFHSPNSSS